MKKVEAMVQLSEIHNVKDGLAEIGIERITVMEVRTFGKLGPKEICRGRTYQAPYISEAKVEMVVPDEIADSAIAIIRETSLSDEPWDRRIFVSSLDDPSLPRKKTVAAA